MADTKDLDPGFNYRLQALVNASGGRLYIVSGFRSEQQQQQLWDAAVKKYGSPEAAQKWVARPGHSNHNRGIAADLGGDMSVAHQLAPQFGLYFPMSWEPWHVEPVSTANEGQDPAAYTPSPNGDPNPTQQNRGNDVAYWAAMISHGLTADIVPGASLTDFTKPQPQGEDMVAQAAPGSTATNATLRRVGENAGQHGGGTVDPAQLYKALVASGIDAVHAAALVAIAGRESGYRLNAYNPNHATGDESHGLFQINTLGGQHQDALSAAGGNFYTLQGSVAGAKVLYDQSGLTPWGPYKGQSWSTGTNLAAAAAASGGQVTEQQLEAIANEGMR